jgi:hypothetical protein
MGLNPNPLKSIVTSRLCCPILHDVSPALPLAFFEPIPLITPHLSHTHMRYNLSKAKDNIGTLELQYTL